MNDLFDSEERTILHAQKVIDQLAGTEGDLAEEYRALFRQYKKLYKQLIRLIKINDRQTHKLNAENIELEKHSRHDALTGILNRRSFDEALATEWARSLKNMTPLSILMIDIDHFKNFNDSYGHQTGDNVLIQVASQIQAAARRRDDIAARYGGEEFVLMLPGVSSADAGVIGERLRDSVEEMIFLHQHKSLQLTISIGIATIHGGVKIASDVLLNQADQALYLAKRKGRNKVCFFHKEVSSTGESYD